MALTVYRQVKRPSTVNRIKFNVSTNMQKLLNSIIEQFTNHTITIEHLIALGFVLVVISILYTVFEKRLFYYLYERNTIADVAKKKLRSIIRLCLLLISLIISVLILGINIGIPDETSSLTVVNILWAVLIVQIARLFEYFFGRVVNKIYRGREGSLNAAGEIVRSKPEQTASSSLKYAIYTFAIILILKKFNIDYELFSFEASGNLFHFRISSIFGAILILFIARLIVWAVTQIILRTYYHSREVNIGSQYAINQLVSYVIYIVAIVLALDNLGVQMTVLWGGLAALLVGVGLGLQQTFNDLFSGILLLFERTVEVGDVVNIDGEVGRVKRIGLRTSSIESRDHIMFIIPNSKLVMDNIINWSHTDLKVRFTLEVGVAYGSDVQLVKDLLLQVAAEHSDILKYPTPIVRFANFGESSLDFELLFYSKKFIAINDVRSDLRFAIDELFKTNRIEIPFPQRDVWMRSGG